MESNLKDVKKSYGTLLIAYMNTLNESTKTKSILGIQRYITNQFIESHIKTNLLEISNSLRYYSEIIKIQNNFNVDTTWIMDRITDCNELSRTLTSWQSAKSIIATITPPIIGLIVAKLGLETIYQAIELSDLQLSFIVLLTYIGILLIFLGISFIYKRSIFRRFEIYRLEKTLFSLLNRNLKSEFPFDLVALGIGINLFIAMTIYGLYQIGFLHTYDVSFNSWVILDVIISLGIVLELRQRSKESNNL